MSTLQAVAYLSRANKTFLQHEIDHLLLSTSFFNRQNEITGVLLYNTGLFFQYFEGSPNAVDLVYERIKKDENHQLLIEILNEPIENRQCDDWCMGFCKKPNSFIQELAHQNWLKKSSKLNINKHKSEGVNMLMKFWTDLAT